MKNKSLLLFFILVCATAWSPAYAEHKSLVLVCGAHSDIQRLTTLEVRKLFLGHPIINIKDGQRLAPFRNISDPLLQEVFLQKIMFISERSYERKMLSKALHFGGVKPRVFQKLSSLIKALNNDPHSVSYMWESEVVNNPNIKVVTRLWDGQID